MRLNPIYIQNQATYLLWPLIQEVLHDKDSTPFTFLRRNSFVVRTFTACISASVDKYFMHFIAEPLEGTQDDRPFEVSLFDL